MTYIGVMVVKRTDLPDCLMSLVAFARVTKKVAKAKGTGWDSFHSTVTTKLSEPAPPHMYDRIKTKLMTELKDLLAGQKGLSKQQILDAEKVVWEI